jgi:membrane-associated protein
MNELLQQVKEVFLCVMPFSAEGKFVGFDSDGLMKVLAQPEITLFSMFALALIVFTETGLLVGFFLPGDSLLVTAGIVAWNSDWNLAILIPILIMASILGDSTGYLIGKKLGPAIFSKDDSFLFRKSHLLHAKSFYETYIRTGGGWGGCDALQAVLAV